MTQDTEPMIDVLEMQQKIRQLSEENETLKLLLTFADARINKMVKEAKVNETRGNPCKMGQHDTTRT